MQSQVSIALPAEIETNESPREIEANNTRRIRIWPAAFLAFSFGLNIAWVVLLGYAAIRIIGSVL